MRGDKSPLFMKEAREEAMHFGWGQNTPEDDLMVSLINQCHGCPRVPLFFYFRGFFLSL